MFSQTVILAAGVWSGLLAWETGCGLPFAPVRSHYWITAAHALFSREQSVVILPEARAYARPEGGRLLFGLREAHSVAVDPRALPDHLTGYTSEGDPRGWKALIEGGPALERFCPALTEVQIAHYIAGLSAYTPDGLPLLGSWPGFQGAFVATGFSGMGIALAGGAGRALAELVAGQPATFDLSAFEPGRFGSVDPMSESFRQRCADARSRKVSG
jgi:4-methylaminobutanoate oxidase (formaldehyde-forming)